MPGVPGAQVQQAAGAGFVLMIPADPIWEPFEMTDSLDNDGYYLARIKGEKPRTDADKSAGLFLTLEILDEDAKGRTVSKFLPDPNRTKGNTWWIWRSLIRSITGSLEVAKQGLNYTPGMFTNQVVAIRTAAYADDNATRTGVEAFVLKSEHEEAVAANRHRWPAKVKPAGAGPVGALPGGLPAAFPGVGGGGLPGAPSGGGVPRPTGAAPIVQGFPQAGAPAQAAPAAFVAPPPAAVPAPAGFPTQQPQAPAPAPFGFPAPTTQAAPQTAAPGFPAANGVAPQPAVNSPFPGFPTPQQ